MLKKIRYSIFAAIIMVAMTAGLLGSCVDDTGTVKIAYVEWA